MLLDKIESTQSTSGHHKQSSGAMLLNTSVDGSTHPLNDQSLRRRFEIADEHVIDAIPVALLAMLFDRLNQVSHKLLTCQLKDVETLKNSMLPPPSHAHTRNIDFGLTRSSSSLLFTLN